MSGEPRVVLVTGGANGIGEAVVRRFAANGDALVFGDIADDRGRALAEELTAAGGRAFYRHADMTREADVSALVELAVTELGALDVAVNVVGNLGGGDRPGTLLHDSTLEQWNGTLAQSLTSMFLSMKYELAFMVEHGGGNIVNFASTAGMLIVPTGSAAYAAAKAGVVHLTRGAAVTYAERNIRVNAVAPGITRTENAERNVPGLDRAVISRHPIPRPVEPAEQAAAAFWLASDESAMITGHTLPVDGGWTAK